MSHPSYSCNVFMLVDFTEVQSYFGELFRYRSGKLEIFTSHITVINICGITKATILLSDGVTNKDNSLKSIKGEFVVICSIISHGWHIL